MESDDLAQRMAQLKRDQTEKVGAMKKHEQIYPIVPLIIWVCCVIYGSGILLSIGEQSAKESTSISSLMNVLPLGLMGLTVFIIYHAFMMLRERAQIHDGGFVSFALWNSLMPATIFLTIFVNRCLAEAYQNYAVWLGITFGLSMFALAVAGLLGKSRAAS